MEKRVTIDIYVPEIRLLGSDYGWEGFRFSIPLIIFCMAKRSGTRIKNFNNRLGIRICFFPFLFLLVSSP